MRLVFASGPRAGSTVEIDGGRLTIGRIAGNDLQLGHETVSRHHAVIEIEHDARVVLRDLGSRNGTFVDDQRLSGACTLHGGEHLRFGDERLLAQSGEAARAEPREATDQANVTRSAAPSARRKFRALAYRQHVRRRGAREHEPERPMGLPPQARAQAGARKRLQAVRKRRWLPAVVALAVLAALVFGVGQLVLPGVAEERLRSQLARNGAVRVVHVESVPAVKLLWQRADSVRVAMDTYRSAPTGAHASLADFLSRTRDTDKLDVSVGTLQSKLVTLHNVRLHKAGDVLIGQAELTQGDLSAALPSFLNLRPVSASSEGIVVAASASLLGHGVGIHLAVLASGGRVIVRPEGLPLSSLATITVFSDPRIYVESLQAELNGERYLLTARARLR
jgi:hypothetical protein